MKHLFYIMTLMLIGISSSFAQNDGATGTNDGYGYVDLGLPSGTIWATSNVGATKPEEYGNYYAWGETETKYAYDWSNYKWGTGPNKLTKYNKDKLLGKVDNLTSLVLTDDAAYVNCGVNWRMPTKTQFAELRSKCQWTWTTINNIKGYEIKGPNNCTVFLPAAGHYIGSNYWNNDEGYYWSNELSGYIDIDHEATYLKFDETFGNKLNYVKRCYGLTIRPVYVGPTSLTLDKTELVFTKIGKESLLVPTVLPESAVKTVTWKSSNSAVATVDEFGSVTSVSSGTATITATATANNNIYATCKVTVNATDTNPTSVSLSKTTTSMYVGDTETLTATLTPTGATTTLTWSSSNNSVATVNNGKVTAVSAGTATITVKTANNLSATCKVTVKDQSVSGISWNISSDGTLTISGNGDMPDYEYQSSPWYNDRSSIKNIVVKEGITSLGKYALYNLSNVKTVTLPSTLEKIGEHAFSFCTSLESIDIPKTESIGKYAFNYCYNLKSIILPSTLKTIDKEAFHYCPELEKIKCYASEPPALGSEVFSKCPCTNLYVPKGSKSLYQAADQWKDFTNIIEFNSTDGIISVKQSDEVNIESKMFNINGIRIKDSNAKGIIIINGKKFYNR